MSVQDRLLPITKVYVREVGLSLREFKDVLVKFPRVRFLRGELPGFYQGSWDLERRGSVCKESVRMCWSRSSG
jgi:hypothetical protein